MLDLRSNKGLTLLEVMIVAAVIGVLAAMTSMAYTAARQSAQVALCRSNQKTIYEAAVLYELNEPDDLESKGQKARLDALVDRGYIKKNTGFECPSSIIKDYDDYVMVFENGYITDVNCETRAEEHVWPPPD
ncbi:MAG: prepilin-type N-terminal cleavage/methylation domain-containing protein [Candidatus Omnitrophota bacterium]